ncbi:2-amino-4-hydroxy-6-hydroxymethyldihydropteridine diphosphokinase [Rhodococcoides trifolii]|uniref:2-amino-4-hydroxy-6-hydroxymethyldihydropteridine diphosphokinase n=1 Tax=Rhodococcoides trifolii TaxID=908250 RepID=A0A917G3V6_9NOCA|nr:2-amino-4-hydroxy-6-hydroxymethyldihydropteridine diphosphokinase [Rhodococcus trifolii]GGG20598.1 2-amino-4-hydroxy-6-hydroxymethyldihydropteridine diphosphokinase [Rhodococcus trifolii]
MKAVLSIGSNVGDSLAHLQSVLDDLGDAATAVSAVYSTEPWGGVEQQDFLNAVVLVEENNTDCWGWLRRGQSLEQAAQRTRLQHWGPRSLDVDVVVCDDVRSDDPELVLPHPHAHERAFVLVPWLDVDPAAALGAVPVADLLAALPEADRRGVRRTNLVLVRKPS